MECSFTLKKALLHTSRVASLIFLLTLTLGISKSYAQLPRQRVYANEVQKNNDDYLLLIKAGYVDNENNAIDGNIASYAELNSTVVRINLIIGSITLGGEAILRLRFTGADKPAAGTPVTVKLGLGGNVLSVLDGLTVQAVNGPGNSEGNGNEVGPVYTHSQLLNVLGGENQIEFTVTPTVAYDGIKIKLGAPENSLLSVGALASAKVFHAYFTKPADGITCESPIDVLYGSTGNVAGVLNPVENPYDAIDKDENTAALLRTNVSLLNSTYITGIYPSLSKAGDSIKIVLREQSSGLLDLNLLAQNLKIRTYNDNNLAQELALNASLLRLRLLGGSSNKYVLTYPTTTPFNRIQISLGEGLAQALSGLHVYEITRTAQKPIIQSPGLTDGSLTVCEGAPANLTISPAESGSTYKWFDSDGNQVTTGLNSNGTSFSPTGLTAGTHTFYVALYRNGCTDAASERTQINIIVTPAAIAADINASNTEICLGNDALLAAPTLANTSITNPVFQWYADANKSVLITNGTINGITYALNADGSLGITGLTATRNYYISVTGSGVCENTAGNLKEVTVTVNNIPQPVIDLAGNQTIGTGGSITFTATASGASSYQWYKGTDIISGATNSTYTINNATAADAGVYTVIAYGISGCSSVASAAVNLQVGGFGSTKTVEGLNANGKIDAGSELTYKITITNTGSTNLNSVSISDPVPAGTTYVAGSADENGIDDNGVIKWENLSIPANNNLTVSFKVKVDDDLTLISSIGNKATVTVPGETPQEPEVLPIATEQTGSFTANKKVSGLNTDNKIEAGSVLTYTIEVQNTGNIALNNISVIDPIPTGTSYVSNSADNGGAEDSGAIKWTINVGVGETKAVSFQVTVANDLTNILSIANKATITNPNDPTNPTDAEVPPTETVRNRSFTSAKTDNITTGTKIKSGDEITYNITVTNTGNVTLDNISIVDPIPAGTTYVDGSASDNALFSANTLEWNVSVAVGTPKTVTFKVKVNDDLTGVASIKNRATITDTDDPGNPPQNPESPDTQTEQIISYDVAKALTSGLNTNGKIEPEAELTYTISVTNLGNVTLDNITIEDVLPNGTIYVQGSADNGGILTNNTLSWTINVPVGTAPKTVSFKVKVSNDLTGIPSIGNTATITDDTTPTEPTEQNPKQTSTPTYQTEQSSSFEVSSSITSADPSGKATPDTDLTITVTVTNTGNIALTNVAIENLLPAYTSYVSGGTYNPQTSQISLNIPSIAMGATESVSFVVKTNANLNNVTAINNAAIITANSVSKTAFASLEVSCTTANVATVSVTGNNNGGICANSSNTAEIVITSTYSNTTYYLYEGNSLVASNNTGVFTVPVVSGSTYTFSAGVTADGYCETAVADRKSITFVVNPLPSAPSVTSTNVSVCEGTPAVLTIASPQANFTYNWYNADGVLQGSGSPFTTVNISNNTTFYAEAVSASGCIGTARTAITITTITAPAAPTSASVTNGPVCIGSTATLKVDNPVSGIIYRWYTDLTGGTFLKEGESYTTDAITANTTFYVESVSQTTNCSSTTRTPVAVETALQLETPVASVQSKTMNSITFIWNAVTNAQGYEVSIDGGNTWIAPSAGTNATTHTVSGLKPTQDVSFSVRAKGINDCQTSANATTLNITTDNPLGNEVFIPNTFTPNNDGQNDYFMVYGNAISAINMRVFNQWGQLIFQSTRPDTGWDGTYKGQAQPTAVYVYQAEITFKDGSKTNKKGTVTLIR